ncbi:hypothetical protein HMPREF0083_00476 [Aneurinibacillus aneurinilyticus ATCC 12856]|uniref:Uncharacterized protein n=1 Tax=Aneurinibacillus aneurinilyticus ATCC 12856 TaxID=649747 RepID=U1WS97_ANEAE|nr:hypothetical protein HMPREF0083_00476 [Aneurinibacillus aneurinilyticus ATCC 12856]
MELAIVFDLTKYRFHIDFSLAVFSFSFCGIMSVHKKIVPF